MRSHKSQQGKKPLKKRKPNKKTDNYTYYGVYSELAQNWIEWATTRKMAKKMRRPKKSRLYRIVATRIYS
jgi:hypothetical protein